MDLRLLEGKTQIRRSWDGSRFPNPLRTATTLAVIIHATMLAFLIGFRSIDVSAYWNNDQLQPLRRDYERGLQNRLFSPMRIAGKS